MGGSHGLASLFGKNGVQSNTPELAVRSDLAERMEWIRDTDPFSIPDQNDRLAFLINAYNLSVIDAVVDLKQRSRTFAKRGVRSPFMFIRFFLARRVRIGKYRVSLSKLEHRWIRKGFDEPRIHFALNCGAASCPPLREGLYRGATLDEELRSATQLFLSSPIGAIPKKSENILKISRIFRWYKKDFGGKAGVLSFLTEYLPRDLSDWLQECEPEIQYMVYDWETLLSLAPEVVR